MKHTYPEKAVMGAFLCLCCILAAGGCTSKPASTAVSQDELDRQASENKLHAMMAAKQMAQTQAEVREQRQQQEEQRRQEEAAKPHYPPDELRAAAASRKWATITVPDLNVKAVFNSTWTDGNLNYRVALLGQRPAISTFLHDWSKYKINFSDQSGNSIFAFDVYPGDFQWEPDSYNGGIPTMDTQGSVPCDLPIYEQSVQWNLTWEG